MKNRATYAVFMAVSGILAAAFAAAWIVGIYKSYGLKSDIAAISATTETKSANEVYLLSLKDTLRDSKDDLAVIDSRFISKDGIPAFIDMLETRAKSANVKADLSSINLDESGDPLLPRALSIHMAGSGLWKDVVGFTSAVETLPYALRIDDIQFSRGTNSAWGFNADLTAYVVN